MNKDIANKIRKLREAKNIDLKRIADEVGILSTSFSKIERVGTNSVDTLIKIAEALGVSPRDFFDEKVKLSVKEGKQEYGYASKEELTSLTNTVFMLVKEIEKLRDELSSKKSSSKNSPAKYPKKKNKQGKA